MVVEGAVGKKREVVEKVAACVEGRLVLFESSDKPMMMTTHDKKTLRFISGCSLPPPPAA